MTLLIHHKIREAKTIVVAFGPLSAAQYGFDSRHQLRERERLGDVIVSTEGQSRYPVPHVCLGGEKENRYVKSVGAKALRHLETVEVRKHNVEDYQIEGHVLGHL
jgi:hypothetical protein